MWPTWLLLLAACSRSASDASTIDASTIDAAPCAGRRAPALASLCAPGELAGMAVDGVWAVTGTSQQDAMPEQAYTGTITLPVVDNGPGWCDLGTARSTGPDDNFIYVDADQIYHFDHSCNGFPCESSGTTTWFVCVRATDGLLFYAEQFSGIRMDLPLMYVISGTLSR